MKNRKVFCEKCRRDVDVIVKEQNLTGIIKGTEYKYLGKVAYCKDCGSEIYLNEVNDSNLKALYDEFRKENNIISIDKILEISEKYMIGKRNLSLLLGWGEHTFSRYCEGDIPTKQYSEILKKIYEDPFYYDQILEENKNNLKTEVAYDKSKRAVNKLIYNGPTKKTKINIAVEYLINKCEDITPLALQKSLYYVQGFYYAFYDKYLFSEDCEAWVHGPVYKEIYRKYKDYRFDPIKYSTEIDISDFTSMEIEILDSVVKNFGCYSGKVLEKFTHSESPWLSARNGLTELETSNQIIYKEEIGAYFKRIKEKYNMITPRDIESYAQTMFKQI